MYTVKDIILIMINSTLTSQYRIHSRCSLINKLFIIGSRLKQSASVTTQLFVWSLFFCFFQPLNKRCHLQNKQRLTKKQQKTNKASTLNWKRINAIIAQSTSLCEHSVPITSISLWISCRFHFIHVSKKEWGQLNVNSLLYM